MNQRTLYYAGWFVNVLVFEQDVHILYKDGDEWTEWGAIPRPEWDEQEAIVCQRLFRHLDKFEFSRLRLGLDYDPY